MTLVTCVFSLIHHSIFFFSNFSPSFQWFLENVMLILWRLWGQWEARKHTSEFLMEGFWPLVGIPPFRVLKACKRRKITASKRKVVQMLFLRENTVKLDKQSFSIGFTLKALWDREGTVITGGSHRVATPVGLVHTVQGDMLSVKNPVRL